MTIISIRLPGDFLLQGLGLLLADDDGVLDSTGLVALDVEVLVDVLGDLLVVAVDEVLLLHDVLREARTVRVVVEHLPLPDRLHLPVRTVEVYIRVAARLEDIDILRGN